MQTNRKAMRPNEHADTNGILTVNVHPNDGAPGRSNDAYSDNSGYEEFFGGSVPCPSCKGSGRIPREQESQLVALIPLSDKRLKPRRTFLYVCLTTVLCLIVAGLLLFFLLPRTIQINSTSPALKSDYIYINTTGKIVTLSVVNMYNVSNANFYDVTVESLLLQITFNNKLLATAHNETKVKVPMKSTQLLYVQINVTFTGDDAYLAQYCSEPGKHGHTILIPFFASAKFSYFQHFEESTLSTYQNVDCQKQKKVDHNNLIHNNVDIV